MRGSKLANPVSWGTFTEPFLDELADWIGGRRVLEVMAGNGLLASRLASRCVEIRATSLFQGHDGHERGLHHAVEEISAMGAIAAHGADADILLVSWPPASEALTKAITLWDSLKPIVFIGEVTDLVRNHLGGCASDAFFEVTEPRHRFERYESRNMLEQAVVLHVKPERLAAAIEAAKRETGLLAFLGIAHDWRKPAKEAAMEPDIWDKIGDGEWWIPVGENSSGDMRGVFIERSSSKDGEEFTVVVKDAGLSINAPETFGELGLAKARGIEMRDAFDLEAAPAAAR
jgi:hypothetical protein